MIIEYLMPKNLLIDICVLKSNFMKYLKKIQIYKPKNLLIDLAIK